MNQEYLVNKFYKGVFILDVLRVKYDREMIKKASQLASKINFDPFDFDTIPSIEEINNEKLDGNWDLELPNDLTLFIERCQTIIVLDGLKDYHNYGDYGLDYGRYSLSTLDDVIQNGLKLDSI